MAITATALVPLNESDMKSRDWGVYRFTMGVGETYSTNGIDLAATLTALGFTSTKHAIVTYWNPDTAVAAGMAPGALAAVYNNFVWDNANQKLVAMAHDTAVTAASAEWTNTTAIAGIVFDLMIFGKNRSVVGDPWT